MSNKEKVKNLLILSSFLLAFLLSGCSASDKNAVTGDISEVCRTDGNLVYITVMEGDSEIGFVWNEETELVWKDHALKDDGKTENENALDGYMKVSVNSDRKDAEAPEEFTGDCVETWYTADTVTVVEVYDSYFNRPTEKPAIYLYPESAVEVSVKLRYNGELTAAWPVYEDGWKVSAYPDGTIYNPSDGREYGYLFWEGIPSKADWNFDKGFCVKGSETAVFLQETLEKIGLSDREANEFIVYWLPRMQESEYNLISFQEESYTEIAELVIEPKPDHMLRVFMAWKPSDEFIELEPQTFPGLERDGFTVVEWGGVQAEDRKETEDD